MLSRPHLTSLQRMDCIVVCPGEYFCFQLGVQFYQMDFFFFPKFIIVRERERPLEKLCKKRLLFLRPHGSWNIVTWLSLSRDSPCPYQNQIPGKQTSLEGDRPYCSVKCQPPIHRCILSCCNNIWLIITAISSCHIHSKLLRVLLHWRNRYASWVNIVQDAIPSVCWSYCICLSARIPSHGLILLCALLPPKLRISYQSVWLVIVVALSLIIYNSRTFSSVPTDSHSHQNLSSRQRCGTCFQSNSKCSWLLLFKCG